VIRAFCCDGDLRGVRLTSILARTTSGWPLVPRVERALDGRYEDRLAERRAGVGGRKVDTWWLVV
jgi:hypothetical protein